MHEGPVALRSLFGELGRLGRSSGSWEERQARLLRRIASQYTLVSTTDPDDRLRPQRGRARSRGCVSWGRSNFPE